MEEIEIWKPVVGYEGLYEVSSLGGVKSLNYRNTGKDKTMKPSKVGGGKTMYLAVNLWQNKNKKMMCVHKLVAAAFIPNPKNLPQANHKDNNSLNNKKSNLEWVTNRENVIHAYSFKNTSSKHAGVHWCKRDKKWIAKIRINDQRKCLGYFEKETDAADAYQTAFKLLAY